MRRIFTTNDTQLTREMLRWGVRQKKWRRAQPGVFVEGPAPLEPIDLARAKVLAQRTVARGTLAGVLHGLDSVTLDNRPTRRTSPPWLRSSPIGGVPCAHGLTTMLDLAPLLNDKTWEHAFESALRKKLTSVEGIEALVSELSRARMPGISRIRRVLALRPLGAPATESLLETLMVQLARDIPGLAPPVRQFTVYDEHGEFVARVDLCWPQLGLFIELDGQHHPGQPVYDARRETAVVATMGWLVGRFTWYEVTALPHITTRRLAALVEQARRRPLPQSA